jgi:hypothetical protein
MQCNHISAGCVVFSKPLAGSPKFQRMVSGNCAVSKTLLLKINALPAQVLFVVMA